MLWKTLSKSSSKLGAILNGFGSQLGFPRPPKIGAKVDEKSLEKLFNFLLVFRWPGEDFATDKEEKRFISLDQWLQLPTV